MTESWVCPYCGFENPITIRVAFTDICVRCKRQKVTQEELIVEYTQRCNEIDRRIDELKESAGYIADKILTLENHICELQGEKIEHETRYKTIQEEAHELADEMTRLELAKNHICIIGSSQNNRKLTKDQRKLEF